MRKVPIVWHRRHQNEKDVPDGVDTFRRVCAYSDCSRQPLFGVAGIEKAEYCSQYAKDAAGTPLLGVVGGTRRREYYA